ncbi:MAG: LarC family nickel insertion protein, partial [Chthoniobacterales bacterium]|nr:LarC family nickel insertion protein [Chthoniobacterales bacterium]
VGYGAGSRNPQDYPNALRILLGLPLTVSHPDLHSSPQASLNSSISHSHDESPPQEVVEIRANLDDSTPEIIGYLIELLLKKGALDAWCTPATMKKSRPGFILHAITTPEQTTLISNLILRESSTFGIRFHTCQRRVLSRKSTEVPTPYGQIRMKLGYLNGELLRVEPEYESCSQVALITDTPLNKVYDAAKSAWEFLTEHK